MDYYGYPFEDHIFNLLNFNTGEEQQHRTSPPVRSARYYYTSRNREGRRRTTYRQSYTYQPETTFTSDDSFYADDGHITVGGSVYTSEHDFPDYPATLNIGIIVGPAVAGGVSVLIVLGILIYCYKRSQQQKQQQRQALRPSSSRIMENRPLPTPPTFQENANEITRYVERAPIPSPVQPKIATF